MEGTELDRYAGTDADEGGECAFVEGEGALGGVDGFGCLEGVGVLCGGLETDFYYVEGLACGCVSWRFWLRG